VRCTCQRVSSLVPFKRCVWGHTVTKHRLPRWSLKSSQHPLHDKVVHVTNNHLVWCWQPFLFLFIPSFLSFTRYPRLFMISKQPFNLLLLYIYIWFMFFWLFFLFEIIYKIKIIFQFYPPLIFFIFQIWFSIFFITITITIINTIITIIITIIIIIRNNYYYYYYHY
jgi:hypothetical protein